MSDVTEVPVTARAPRGRSGAVLVRETEHRTGRGAVVTVREWWHRPKGGKAYRYVEARSGSGLLGEYTANRPGNAGMVYEAFSAGVYDLQTPLADLPPGLSRAMGRAWLKAEPDRACRTPIVGEHDFSGSRDPRIGLTDGGSTPTAVPRPERV